MGHLIKDKRKIWLIFEFTAALLFFILISPISAQRPLRMQGKDVPKTDLILIDTNISSINKKEPVLPVMIRASKSKAYSVKLTIPVIASPDGAPVNMKYLIYPEYADIPVNETGIFKISFDKGELEKSAQGKYVFTVLVSADNAEPVLKQINILLKPSGKIAGYMEWGRDNLFAVLWNFLKIISVIFIIFVFSVFAWKGSHSLNVLQIINETGEKGETEGVASGIDDLLIKKLQDIRKLSSSEEIKHYWVIPQEKDRQGGRLSTASATVINIAGGESLQEVQKIGDISIGAFKIPLGSIIAFITKFFGGNYVSGVLQKYGKTNKIVLRLEQRPPIIKIFRSSEINYIEASWEAEKLPEGVPHVIEQLAYEIILKLSKKVDTNNWEAFKSFLEGNYAYEDFERNRTRRDRLRYAISSWTESIRLDSNFAKAHFNLGLALDIEGRYEDAVFRYEKAISLSPELIGAEAHYSLAKLYRDIFRDDSKTLEELKKAKTIDASLPEIYNLEGLIYSGRKDDKAAAELYETAIKADIKNPEPVFYYNLSIAQYYLGIDNPVFYDQAQKNAEQALEIYWERILKKFYGENAQGIFQGSDRLKEINYLLRGRDRNIKKLLQTLGWIHNKKGSKYIETGNLNIAKSEYEKALSYFESALTIEPGNKDMLDGYGEALRETGQAEKALMIQRRPIRLWPEYDRGYDEISKTLRILKNPEEIIAAFQKIANALRDDRVIGALNTYDIAGIESLFEEILGLKDVSRYEDKIYAASLGAILHYHFGSSKDGGIKNMAEEAACKYLGMLSVLKDVGILLEPEVLHIYGLALTNIGSYEDAIRCLEDAGGRYEEDQIFDLAECYSDIGKAGHQAKYFKMADNAYGIAIEYYKKGNLANAAAEAHISRAECLIDWAKSGDWNKIDWALAECNKAIQLDNNNSGAYHVKGNIYYNSGLNDKAIPQYEMAVEINYELPGAHYNLGLCYLNMGEYEQASRAFEAAIIIDEQYADPYNLNKPDPYRRLPECLEKQRNLPKAIDILQRAVTLFPKSAKYNLLLGEYLQKTGHFDEAAQKYESGLKSDPENRQRLKHLLLNNLADLYIQLGVYENEAYKMLREALIICKEEVRGQKQIALEKDLLKIRNNLGWTLYRKNMFKKAVMFLEGSFKYSLGDPKNHTRLAMAYEKYAGQFKDINIEKTYLEKAKEQMKIVSDLGVLGI
ncbi:MAG: tetratricopeptide repeat protein [Nitrospirota bacterium]